MNCWTFLSIGKSVWISHCLGCTITRMRCEWRWKRYDRDVSTLGKPKLGLPGSPGVVSVGGELHGGHGYKNAVVDGYPIRFGLRVRKRTAPTTSAPVKKRYYKG